MPDIAKVARLFAAASLLAAPTTALAEFDEGCELSQQDLRELLSIAEGAIAAGKLPIAFRVLQELREELPCYVGPIDRADLTRFSGALSVVWYIDQDDAASRRWARLRGYVAPDAPWTIAAPPPYVEEFDDLSDAPLAMPTPPNLIQPKKGAMFYNGALKTDTLVPTETPGLVQILDKKGRTLDAYWQDGTRFKPEHLGDAPEKAPKWAYELAPPVGSEAPAAHKAAPEAAPATEGQAEPQSQGWVSKANEKDWMPDCPWAGVPVIAHATQSAVTVNGQTWQVDTDDGRRAFSQVLHACYEFRAARRFEQWRNARANAGVDLDAAQQNLIGLAGAIGGAGAAAAAEVHRGAMLKALRDNQTEE